MFLHIFLENPNYLLVMVRMIHLDAVNRYFGAQLVEQRWLVKREASLAPPWMSDQAHCTALMCCLHRLGHIRHNRAEPGFRNHCKRRLSVGRIAMLNQQRGIIDRAV